LEDIQTPQTTLDEIFEYLEAADKPCIVAINEFQQISNYEEKNVEALLRTKIQQCKQTQFVFAGSKRHLMSNMFYSSSKPFYQSAFCMGLEPIPLEAYAEFATHLFETRGKHVSQDLIKKVYQQFNGCTWFVQMLMNELNVTSSAFIKKYNLPSASSAQSAIKGLLKNDIITQEEDGYRIYDYFFANWLAKDY